MITLVPPKGRHRRRRRHLLRIGFGSPGNAGEPRTNRAANGPS